MDIRLLHSEQDAKQYRDLRFEALQTVPEAFASSYKEEKGLSVADIQRKFQTEESFTYGAFTDQQLMGVITLYKEAHYKLQHRVHIGAMYVSPSQRGSGIGSALMKEAIAKAKELPGIEQIYLAVVSTNTAAKKMYTSLGFEVFGTEKRGLKLGEGHYYDVDFMILYL